MNERILDAIHRASPTLLSTALPEKREEAIRRLCRKENFMNTAAYKAGYSDGLAWDLSGFACHEDVVTETRGWDEATLNAMGSVAFAAHCGISLTERAVFEKDCAEYNAGCHAGACADQSERTGSPPNPVDAI